MLTNGIAQVNVWPSTADTAQLVGVTEVTKLANAGQASSLGQVSAGQNLFVFGFGGSGGGTLRYAGSAASTSDRAFSLRGSTAAADNTIEAAGTSAAATLTLTGELSASASGSYTARLAGDNAGVNEYAGVIANGSGTVGLEKTGSTTWALTGANTYSGATTVSAGNLNVGAGGTTGSLGGGAVSVASGATLAFDRSNTHTVANVISGSGSVVQLGSGLTTLSGANTFSGGTTISVGTLAVAAIADSGTSLVAAAGTTLLNATQRAVDEIRALDAGATVRLAQPNQVFNGDAISTTGNIRMTGGTLDLAGHDQEISRLIGADNSTAGTGTITSSTPATFTVGNNFSGRPSIFDGSITGDVAVVTRGSNPITFGGTSSYTGPTNVTGSRLSVNGSLGNTAVTVANGADLGGSGSIGGSVLVQGDGTLAPGNSIDSLAVGATTFEAGATFAYEVDSSADLGLAADLLRVNGDLNLSTDVDDLSLLSFVDIAGTPLAFTEDTTVFAMINYTGSWNGGLFFYNSQTLADGSRFFVGSQQWEIDYDYVYDTANPTTIQPLNFQSDYAPASGTQTFVAITAVPEPSTIVLLAAAAGLVLLRRTRCRSPRSGTRRRATP